MLFSILKRHSFKFETVYRAAFFKLYFKHNTNWSESYNTVITRVLNTVCNWGLIRA